MKSKDMRKDRPQTAESNEISPAVVPFCKNASVRNGSTAAATARWMSECRLVGRDTTRRKEDASDQRVSDLMSRLYFDAKCGHAGAEYNLEREGMIAMIFGHVAGQMRNGDNYWEDTRWMVTELGKRTSMAQLRRIVLHDPPLEVALRDARRKLAMSPMTVEVASPMIQTCYCMNASWRIFATGSNAFAQRRRN